ncbi:hypothetical protein HAX54_008740 [Datura stramonium]|uniref:Uncharacterized protein n=1 Tax=Datura stramonium TaxID=4076 RepID=A0ABS8TGB0_DATST|nr:hypothetical protein [Datura stramonium]
MGATNRGPENSSRSLPPPSPPRFSNVDETYLPRQQPYGVNSTTQLDHDTIDRIYTNFEEDLEDSQEVQEEKLEETPTPTSSVMESRTFTRATRDERPKRPTVEDVDDLMGDYLGLESSNSNDCDSYISQARDSIRDANGEPQL